MARKNKKTKEGKIAGPEQAVSVEPISSRGWKVIGCGAAVLVLGFFILTFSDPMGRNWASLLSPFLIIGAYVLIGIGIFLPKKTHQSLP